MQDYRIIELAKLSKVNWSPSVMRRPSLVTLPCLGSCSNVMIRSSRSVSGSVTLMTSGVSNSEPPNDTLRGRSDSVGTWHNHARVRQWEATNHDDQLGEIYPTMLNELNCTFYVRFSRFLCRAVMVMVCGGRGLWSSWYRPLVDLYISNCSSTRSSVKGLQRIKGAYI